MANELAKAQANTVAQVDDPFGYEGEEGSSGGTTFIKFVGASGKYLAGADDEEIEHGSAFAADFLNASYEWLFWWDGEIMDRKAAKLVEDATLYERRPDWLPEDPEGVIDLTLEEIEERQADMDNNNNDGWSIAAVLPLRGLEGEMGGEDIGGEDFTLKLNQGVALTSFHSLRKSYGKSRKFHAGKTPVVTLDVNAYEPKSKKAGKRRFAPVIKIEGWKTDEELMAMIGEAVEEYDPEESAAPQVEDKSVDTSADAAEDEAPQRRRGRRGKF